MQIKKYEFDQFRQHRRRLGEKILERKPCSNTKLLWASRRVWRVLLLHWQRTMESMININEHWDCVVEVCVQSNRQKNRNFRSASRLHPFPLLASGRFVQWFLTTCSCQHLVHVQHLKDLFIKQKSENTLHRLLCDAVCHWMAMDATISIFIFLFRRRRMVNEDGWPMVDGRRTFVRWNVFHFCFVCARQMKTTINGASSALSLRRQSVSCGLVESQTRVRRNNVSFVNVAIRTYKGNVIWFELRVAAHLLHFSIPYSPPPRSTPHL